MAGRSDAATDRCSRATAPSMATVTIAAWAKVVNSASPLFHPIMRLSDAGDATLWIVGFKGANGRTPSVYSASNTTGISGAEVALGTWVYVAATLSGTAAQLLTGTVPGTLSKVTGTVGSGTPTQFGVFGRSAADGSEWLDGSIAYLRVWTSVLSDAQIAAESQSATPVVTAGLWGHWPFAAAALTDTSGNSRNLTAGSTALASDTDPTLTTGHTINVGFAISSHVAGAVTRTKSRTVGLAAFGSVAQAVSRIKARAVGVAAQATAALAVGRTKARSVGLGTETGAVQAVARTKRRTIGAALENWVAGAVGRRKSRAVPAAGEAYSAGVVTVAGQHLVPVGFATETSVARPITRAKARVLGLALETALAWLPGRRKARTVGTAAETDQVFPRSTQAGPWPPHFGPSRQVVRARAGQPTERAVVLVGPAVVREATVIVGRPRVLT
jgi:hypothetical protein